MAIEIERKYLVVSSLWQVAKQQASSTHIRQGYLSLDPVRTVRIRLQDKQALLTIKGKNEGITRQEFEYNIPFEEGLAMLNLCEGSIISKTRYTISYNNTIWEIDEFHGDNSGLIVAEVELPSSTSAVKLPKWIDQEVSLDPKYYNANLVYSPFKDWE